MAKSTLEVIRGLAQAAANSFDGAMDENGEPIKIGLSREDGDPHRESRDLDGFGITFRGPILCVKYHGQIRLKSAHDKGFESEIQSRIEDIVKFIKKEYKKNMGSAVTLTSIKEPKINITYISRVRSDVNAYQDFTIGGFDAEKYGHDLSEPSEGRSVDDAIKKFLAMDKDKYPSSQKPKNRTAKNSGKTKLDNIYR